MDRFFIYLAGPMALGYLDGLIHAAEATQRLWEEKRQIAYSPYGMLFHNMRFGNPGMATPGTPDYEEMMEYCFETILRCGAILRLPGKSSGADREVEFARDNNIPVYISVDQVPEFIG